GPFRLFIQAAPPTALDTIIRIVEHATASYARGTNPLPLADLRIDDEWVTITGDASLLNWHRGAAGLPYVLVSALMAVEQECYRRIDGGESVSDIAARIFESRSTPLIGVLISVA